MLNAFRLRHATILPLSDSIVAVPTWEMNATVCSFILTFASVEKARNVPGAPDQTEIRRKKFNNNIKTKKLKLQINDILRGFGYATPHFCWQPGANTLTPNSNEFFNNFAHLVVLVFLLSAFFLSSRLTICTKQPYTFRINKATTTIAKKTTNQQSHIHEFISDFWFVSSRYLSSLRLFFYLLLTCDVSWRRQISFPVDR